MGPKTFEKIVFVFCLFDFEYVCALACCKKYTHIHTPEIIKDSLSCFLFDVYVQVTKRNKMCCPYWYKMMRSKYRHLFWVFDSVNRREPPLIVGKKQQ